MPITVKEIAEFVKGELVGDGIVRTLSLINSLEINEQILYARMVNVEQTTLIS